VGLLALLGLPVHDRKFVNSQALRHFTLIELESEAALL
jgi:hypothetical protein